MVVEQKHTAFLSQGCVYVVRSKEEMVQGTDGLDLFDGTELTVCDMDVSRHIIFL